MPYRATGPQWRRSRSAPHQNRARSAVGRARDASPGPRLGRSPLRPVPNPGKPVHPVSRPGDLGESGFAPHHNPPRSTVGRASTRAPAPGSNAAHPDRRRILANRSYREPGGNPDRCTPAREKPQVTDAMTRDSPDLARLKGAMQAAHHHFHQSQVGTQCPRRLGKPGSAAHCPHRTTTLHDLQSDTRQTDELRLSARAQPTPSGGTILANRSYREPAGRPWRVRVRTAPQPSTIYRSSGPTRK
jgi:hypothetical protein